jgi:hypothetical protein
MRERIEPILIKRGWDSEDAEEDDNLDDLAPEEAMIDAPGAEVQTAASEVDECDAEKDTAARLRVDIRNECTWGVIANLRRTARMLLRREVEADPSVAVPEAMVSALDIAENWCPSGRTRRERFCSHPAECASPMCRAVQCMELAIEFADKYHTVALPSLLRLLSESLERIAGACPAKDPLARRRGGSSGGGRDRQEAWRMATRDGGIRPPV